jgi:hypothetical protein
LISTIFCVQPPIQVRLPALNRRSEPNVPACNGGSAELGKGGGLSPWADVPGDRRPRTETNNYKVCSCARAGKKLAARLSRNRGGVG